MKKNNLNNRQGFSLIEILLSMMMMVMIIGGVVIFSSRTMQAHMKSRSMQNAIDNARVAIEVLNKRIRTSNSIDAPNLSSDNENYSSGGSDRIFIRDNQTDYGICYKIESGTLKVAVSTETDPSMVDEYKKSCADFDSGEFEHDLVGGANVQVSGKFFVKATAPDTPTQRGMVSTVLKIDYDGGSADQAEIDSTIIQSTVSLRDYN